MLVSGTVINHCMMKTRLYIFVFVAAMGLSAAVAGAQEPQDGVTDGPRVMTLHDCMEYAISNSTKIRIQQAAIGDAQIARRDAALTLFTPQINAQTYAYYNFGRSIDPQTNTYFNTTSFHNNYGVSAGYDLFDGFKAVNNYKISKTGMLIADSQEKQVEADICLAVMEAYYNVVYYKRLCDVYEEQVAVAEQALAKAKRQEELGQKGHADVIQMEADLADRQYDLTNTYNMYCDQKMTLADLMFWPMDEELNIDTSMPVWQVEPVATESVVDFALEHNPGIQIASWQELNAKRELNTAKWSLLPTVGLYAGWSTSYYTYQGSQTATFRDQFKNNGGEYVELYLEPPQQAFCDFPEAARLGQGHCRTGPEAAGCRERGTQGHPGPRRSRHGLPAGPAQGRSPGRGLHPEPQEVGAGPHLPAGIPDCEQQFPQGPGR